jgi:large subunit ribosomal protein L10Ae
MEPTAEDAAAAAPDSWETADIDGPMSRLILSARRVSSSPDLADDQDPPQPPPPTLQPQGPPSSAPSAAREDLVAQFDQFLREALEKPRERLSGKIHASSGVSLPMDLSVMRFY